MNIIDYILIVVVGLGVFILCLPYQLAAISYHIERVKRIMDEEKRKNG